MAFPIPRGAVVRKPLPDEIAAHDPRNLTPSVRGAPSIPNAVPSVADLATPKTAGQPPRNPPRAGGLLPNLEFPDNTQQAADFVGGIGREARQTLGFPTKKEISDQTSSKVSQFDDEEIRAGVEKQWDEVSGPADVAALRARTRNSIAQMLLQSGNTQDGAFWSAFKRSAGLVLAVRGAAEDEKAGTLRREAIHTISQNIKNPYDVDRFGAAFGWTEEERAAVRNPMIERDAMFQKKMDWQKTYAATITAQMNNWDATRANADEQLAFSQYGLRSEMFMTRFRSLINQAAAGAGVNGRQVLSRVASRMGASKDSPLGRAGSVAEEESSFGTYQKKLAEGHAATAIGAPSNFEQEMKASGEWARLDAKYPELDGNYVVPAGVRPILDGYSRLFREFKPGELTYEGLIEKIAGLKPDDEKYAAFLGARIRLHEESKLTDHPSTAARKVASFQREIAPRGQEALYQQLEGAYQQATNEMVKIAEEESRALGVPIPEGVGLGQFASRVGSSGAIIQDATGVQTMDMSEEIDAAEALETGVHPSQTENYILSSPHGQMLWADATLRYMICRYNKEENCAKPEYARNLHVPQTPAGAFDQQGDGATVGTESSYRGPIASPGMSRGGKDEALLGIGRFFGGDGGGSNIPNPFGPRVNVPPDPRGQ